MTKIHRKTRVSSDRRVLKIASRVRTGTSRLTRHLDRQLASDGWDLPPSHVEGLNESVVRVLETRNERLAEAICKRREVASRGKQLRRRRDEACREVYHLLVRLREMIHAGAGDAAVRAHFGPGKTPREPWEVWRVAKHLQHVTRSTPQSLCGQIGSEEAFLNWARAVDDPLTRLGACLREVTRIETAEKRTVLAVRKAKDEMRQTQKFAYRLFEGLYGLAGLEGEGKSLRLREPAASTESIAQGPPPAAESVETPPSGLAASAPSSEEPTAERTRTERTTRTKAPGPPAPPMAGETKAAGPAPSPPARRTSAAGRPPRSGDVAFSELRDTEPAPAVPWVETGRPGTLPRTGGGSPETPARRLSVGMKGTGRETDSGQAPNATAAHRSKETEPLDAARPRVWKVVELLRMIPHLGRNDVESGEISASEERAA